MSEDIKNLEEKADTLAITLAELKVEKSNETAEKEKLANELKSMNEKMEIMSESLKERQIKDELFGSKNSEEVEGLSSVEKTIAEYKTLMDLKYRNAKAPINMEVFTKAVDLYAKGSVKSRNEKEIAKLKSSILSAVEIQGSMPLLDVKTMRESVNPDGGYLALKPQQGEIQKRDFGATSIRQIANVISISAESIEFPIDDGLFANLTPGEEGTRSITDTSKIGRVSIKAGEYYASPMVTTKMLDDAAIDLVSWISFKTEQSFSQSEENDFMNGVGLNDTAKGFFTYSAWADPEIYQRGKLATFGTTNAAGLGDMIISMYENLLPSAQANAVFVMHPTTWITILRSKDTTNNYLINPSMLASGYGKTLYGRPVITSQYAPKMYSIHKDTGAITQNSNITGIACGDFNSAYVIADRLGTRRLEDPYTNAGFVSYRTSKRTGGGVINFQDIKLGKTKTA